MQSNADILAEKIAHIKVQIRTLNDFAKDVLKVSTNVPKIGTYDPKVGTPKDDSGELK